MRALSTLLFACLLSAPALTQDWDETVDGDLSDDRFAPTAISLATGTTQVTATQQGNALGRDIDYLTVNVPAGLRWSGLVLSSYTAAGSNLAFLGLQSGTQMTVDPAAPNASLLLGGIVYGSFQVGSDILPTIGIGAGTTGFTPPLPSGDYTFWLNQTGGASTLTIDFLVEPVIVGQNYCMAAVNSTGSIGEITGEGSSFVLLDDFSFAGTSLPQNTFGFAVTSATQGFVVAPGGSSGNLCLGGAIGRFVGQIQSSGPSGIIAVDVDLSAIPQPGGSMPVNPGTAWNFQIWHRDSTGGAPTSNFTNALEVVFR